MTPELLWKIGRVNGGTVTADGNQVIYGVTRYNIGENKGENRLFSIPLKGGTAQLLTGIPAGADGVQNLPGGKIGYAFKGQWWEADPDGSNAVQKTEVEGGMDNIRLSPDGKYILFSRMVKIQDASGADLYPDLPKSNVQIYTDLLYRHWDHWEDGKFSHVFYATYNDGKVGDPVDIMKQEPYQCPQEPYGGPEDFIWSPGGRYIVYVCKKKSGKEYALSTNSDIYFYNLDNGHTTNFTEGMTGYDTQPAFSPDSSRIAWCSMKTDGYESDKNDIIVYDLPREMKLNLTAGWDGTVNNFRWSNDGETIYFTAAKEGTLQLFSVKVPKNLGVRMMPAAEQLTRGDFDIDDIIGQSGDTLLVSRQDMNHATELYKVGLDNGNMTRLTATNDNIYDHLAMSRTVKRWVKTTDGKKELVWVIYPPDFDSTKKYPALLYCQGGPQSPLSQFYSFRWNFQLMAANGYIIIAPNRRGMPGYGVKWNEAISKDWGGQPIQDYLSAVDEISKEPYVDKNRLGCIGASYGGYSVYMLAGVHNGRFKTFIAHDGVFDLRSWYGTTEEMWFANWDIGGPYWDHKNAAAQKSYEKFNPVNYVNKWTAPILIVQGGIDFRVPVEQGLEAFQAAQLRGIKSKLLYLPEENHWVLKCQDALVWQRQFFSWLKETL